MKRRLLTLTVTFFAFWSSYAQLAEKPLGTTDASNGYIEYLPPSYRTNTSQRLPVILFFHGIDEGGNGTTDLPKMYNPNALPALIKNNTWTYKNDFVVLMPQHHSSGCFTRTEIQDFVDYARTTYTIDTTRMYLTGLSCGAIGIWNYIAGNPDNAKVAAAVSIAGDGRSAFTVAGCRITIPIWAFHGTEDKTVLPIGSSSPIDSLTKCPAPKAEAKLTLYPGVLHNSWTRTYNLSAGHDIYTWMLQKRSPGRIITSFEEQPRSSTTAFYPNPSFDVLTVDLGSRPVGKATFRVSDINGRLNEIIETEEAQSSISLADYAPGHYTVSIVTSGSIEHFTFIKR